MTIVSKKNKIGEEIREAEQSVQETVTIVNDVSIPTAVSLDESIINDYDSTCNSLNSTTLFEVDETQVHLETNSCGSDSSEISASSDLSSNTVTTYCNMTKTVAHLVLLLTQSILVDQL